MASQSSDENKKKIIVSCPLCGMAFDANTQKACESCCKKKGCSMTMCPNCYHEFVPAEPKASK